jgi:hypothetical protein
VPRSLPDHDRMGMGPLLIACPSCSCHAFARETRCPRCGQPLRAGDGSIQRTAGAVLLGLTVVAVAVGGACESSTGGGSGGSGGGQGGSQSTMSGFQAVTTYGSGPTFAGPAGVGGTGGGGAGLGGGGAGVTTTTGTGATGTGGTGGK